MGVQALISRLDSILGKTRARKEIARKNEDLRAIRREIRDKDQEIARLQATLNTSNAKKAQVEGIRPENIIWIFGTARTGSTWLGTLMAHPRGHELWREPSIGNLFGSHYYKRAEGKQSVRNNRHYNHFWILGEELREVWIGSIRSFILEGARARFPEMSDEGYLIIKEPHGSMGAPLLMEALPESRMIFLVRDPRDVASTALKSRVKGGWTYKRDHDFVGGGDTLGDVPQDEIVRERAEIYMRDIGRSKIAYEAHQGYKTLIRYEDLRANTLETMNRIYRDLQITPDQEELAQVVQKRSFENIPEEKKGFGTSRRKATPGGWREDLTPEQIEIVETITAPLLAELYESTAVEPGSPSAR